MTTLTTIISMIPMAFGWGSSGEMTKGLALVNIGGLTASTLLSLLMLPVFYCIMSRTPKEQKNREKKSLKKAQNRAIKKAFKKPGDSPGQKAGGHEANK